MSSIELKLWGNCKSRPAKACKSEGRPQPGELFHRACAANLAIRFRSGFDIFCIRAWPAFRAPALRSADVNDCARARPPERAIWLRAASDRASARALPALLAIWRICSSESVAARAAPPNRPRAMACGFFFSDITVTPKNGILNNYLWL